MNSTTMIGSKNSDRSMKAGVIIISILMIAVTLFFMKNTALAAEVNISVKDVNYYDSTITLQTQNNDTVIYFADSTKKWKAVPGKPDRNGLITMDISWVSDTKNYILYFKGNVSTDSIRITIPKKETRFKASFNKLKSTVIFTNAGVRTIEWRKKGSSTWRAVNPATLSTELSYYFTNGAQIYYRLAPVNGTGINAPGMRPSNEVAVTIPKKTAAPAITVDGSRFCIPVKKGMAYRKLNEDGTFTGWISITANTKLMLQDIAPEVMHTAVPGINKSATFQFRYDASSSRQVSNISTVTIPVQQTAPDMGQYGITLNYTSSSTLSLTVKAASSSKPFEYTIVRKGKELDMQTAVWKEITSGSDVNIKSTTAPAGSSIYVRLKSVQKTEQADFSLASVETDISGANGLEYPPAVQTTQLTTLVSTAGVCRTGVSSSYLSFHLYSSTSTTVSSIEFYDAYGSKKGEVTSSSTVAKNIGSTGIGDRYIITTKITSTENVDAHKNERLYAYITLSNQEVIKSTATSGVVLYLYPGTVVNNPSGEEYSTDFKRIYMSNDANDASSFQFRLDLGTEKVIDPTGINQFTPDATAINAIKYNGYTLEKDMDYTVEYGSYVNNKNVTVATATVTVNVSVMEKATAIKATGQALPLVISLNNGEILDDDITITMICSATIDKTPIAWSVTEGSLKEKTTSTVTNPDGTTTTVTTDVNDYYVITLTLFSNSYDVSVSNVTWNGISIFSSASVSQGKATINLSNAKINKLRTEVTETHNIVITLSNGYVIDGGCKLTIINAD